MLLHTCLIFSYEIKRLIGQGLWAALYSVNEYKYVYVAELTDKVIFAWLRSFEEGILCLFRRSSDCDITEYRRRNCIHCRYTWFQTTIYTGCSLNIVFFLKIL